MMLINMSVVTLAEVKEHLRILGNEDDAFLTRLIDVAEEYVEDFTGTLPDTRETVPDGLKQAIILAVEAEFTANSMARARAIEALAPYREWAF